MSYRVEAHPTLEDHYIVCYQIDNQDYKLIAKKIRGPSKIIAAVDSENINWTEELLAFMGPDGDAHGFELTPRAIGCEVPLTIFEISGNEITKFPDELIVERSVVEIEEEKYLAI